jgi:predicted nucleic acid-binding protein
MNDSIFVDTNVLVYAYDRSEPVKQARAAAVLDRLAGTARGVISSQVLGEFFVALTRRVAARLRAEQVMKSVENYAAAWKVLSVNDLVVLKAVRGVRDHRLSYYDAQIWATALLNQIQVVFSEDFNPSRIEGVRFVNPFTDEFDLDAWIS